MYNKKEFENLKKEVANYALKNRDRVQAYVVRKVDGVPFAHKFTRGDEENEEIAINVVVPFDYLGELEDTVREFKDENYDTSDDIDSELKAVFDVEDAIVVARVSLNSMGLCTAFESFINFQSLMKEVSDGKCKSVQKKRSSNEKGVIEINSITTIIDSADLYSFILNNIVNVCESVGVVVAAIMCDDCILCYGMDEYSSVVEFKILEKAGFVAIEDLEICDGFDDFMYIKYIG